MPRVLPFLIVALLVWATPAYADVPTATLKDGADPGLAFDVKQVRVAIDRTAGSLRADIDLYSPAPDPAALTTASLVLWVANSDSSCKGADSSDHVGDVYLSVDRDVLTPTFSATYQVKFRQEFGKAPFSLSPDRLHAAVIVNDPLLAQSAPRCLYGFSMGRSGYDPTQPGGGETMDSLDGTWFDGQDPADPRNRVFSLRYRATSPQRLRPVAAGRYVNLRHSTRCSLACTVRVTGHAMRPGGRRIPGLTLTARETAKEGEWISIGYEFSAAERRRLARAFGRYGRVRYTLRITATDPIGRTQRLTRRITLRPSQAARRSPSRSQTGAGGSGGDRDCSDFSTQRAAQEYFEAHGGSSSNNVDDLDANHDGVACEALP